MNNLGNLFALLDLAEKELLRENRDHTVVLCNSVLNDVRKLEVERSQHGAAVGAGVGATVGAVTIPGFFWLTGAIGGFIGKQIAETIGTCEIDQLKSRAYTLRTLAQEQRK